MELSKGQVVISMAGHDFGMWYVVTDQTGQTYAAVADGKRRPLVRPKRKNIRHLRKTNMKLDLDLVRTDKQLRRALSALREKEGGKQLV